MKFWQLVESKITWWWPVCFVAGTLFLAKLILWIYDTLGDSSDLTELCEKESQNNTLSPIGPTSLTTEDGRILFESKKTSCI